MLIPIGMTWILKQLDVSLNNQFKDLLMEMHVEAYINKKY